MRGVVIRARRELSDQRSDGSGVAQRVETRGKDDIRQPSLPISSGIALNQIDEQGAGVSPGSVQRVEFLRPGSGDIR